ncbi:hypothetical protein AAIH45_35640, partial [Pseudomonas aeruginosa]
MDVYKLKPEETDERPIERERFEEETRRQEPWFSTSENGTEGHFAVCPACDNPVQIIGLYHLPAQYTVIVEEDRRDPYRGDEGDQ